MVKNRASVTVVSRMAGATGLRDVTMVYLPINLLYRVQGDQLSVIKMLASCTLGDICTRA